MMGVLSLVWFVVGIIFVIAGKSILEVAACFLVAAVLSGVYELEQIRQELEDWEEDV